MNEGFSIRNSPARKAMAARKAKKETRIPKVQTPSPSPKWQRFERGPDPESYFHFHASIDITPYTMIANSCTGRDHTYVFIGMYVYIMQCVSMNRD